MTAAAFLSPELLLRGGSRRFNTAVERLLLHLGFDDIRLIDGAGDGGGDILAQRGKHSFVFQNKWTTGQTVGRAAVDEVDAARTKYAVDRAVVVTNAAPDTAAVKRGQALADIGAPVEFWTGAHLERLSSAIALHSPLQLLARPYQVDAIKALERDLDSRKRALLILATGLGKTVVGGEVIRRYLASNPDDQVLVLAPMKDLVAQLERAFWRHLPKTVNTQLLTGDQKPQSYNGVVFATVESADKAIYEGLRPALLMVDETHHVAEDGTLRRVLDTCTGCAQFGVTATPWRGDRFEISTHFGAPSYKMGIADGLAKGYLAQVDYRVFADNVDWEMVQSASREGYTIKELNSKLFLPQRDDAMLDLVWEAWSKTVNPRAIVFCKTIEHAESIAKAMSQYSPAWENASSLHASMGRRERDVALSAFRSGRIPVLTAVDILNEGVDVPDVNIIAFMRVTHSRRIFVQQLGRGLRLRPGLKERVHVLDFVTDIRRLAAILELRRDLDNARAEIETLMLDSAASIRFADENVGTLMEAWLRDAADVETALDEARLQFPPVR